MARVRTTYWNIPAHNEVSINTVSSIFRAYILDFHQPTAADGTHPEMFAWIKKYFNRNLNLLSSCTTPLYFQHQGKFIYVHSEYVKVWCGEYGCNLLNTTSISFLGHSRLVVGFEEKVHKNRNQNLLLFDPSVSQKQMQTLLKQQKEKSLGLTILRKSLKQMKSKKYQIVYVDGIMDEEERQVSPQG